ncbi:MAG: hypothetical protein GY820_41495, partial [Gammaproteobacteria bacterium]|nr:hypothetical protein [Gammaproteobacteria bacterium]
MVNNSFMSSSSTMSIKCYICAAEVSESDLVNCRTCFKALHERCALAQKVLNSEGVCQPCSENGGDNDESVLRSSDSTTQIMQHQLDVPKSVTQQPPSLLSQNGPSSNGPCSSREGENVQQGVGSQNRENNRMNASQNGQNNQSDVLQRVLERLDRLQTQVEQMATANQNTETPAQIQLRNHTQPPPAPNIVRRPAVNEVVNVGQNVGEEGQVAPPQNVLLGQIQ